MRKISNQNLEMFKEHLSNEEKSHATICKYMHDILTFANWLSANEFNKSDVLKYKSEISEKYAPTSVNSIISSLNSFFVFMQWHELKVKTLKVQKQIFLSGDKELTKIEYERLLFAAKREKNDRLYFLMQTICSCGIRISELRHITVESLTRQNTEIVCKGKCRLIFLPAALCKMLKGYIKKKKISSGPIFVTKNGRPLDRSNIWSDMKKLCKSAGVSEKKVFPHNLRHLFARTYYSIQKDIVRLADILGHSSINTTRIYTMESGEVHRRQVEKLGLLRT